MSLLRSITGPEDFASLLICKGIHIKNKGAIDMRNYMYMKVQFGSSSGESIESREAH